MVSIYSVVNINPKIYNICHVFNWVIGIFTLSVCYFCFVFHPEVIFYLKIGHYVVKTELQEILLC